MNIAVVTTFHAKGLDQYAQRMINTFCANWPREIKLHLYPENCNPSISDNERITVTPLESVNELSIFKEKWKDDPKARGWCDDSTQKHPDKTQKVGFRWDAIRFSHKVYSIFDCARKTDADILFWMDADTVCHSPITLDQVKMFCPPEIDIGYLGREGKYSECGLYSLNLRSEMTKNFLREFQRMYDRAETGIFALDEWHDSYVFDIVRKKMPFLKLKNWSEGLVHGEGHPLINSDWGAYLDHLKGDRKTIGKSKDKDLKVKRIEKYWN